LSRNYQGKKIKPIDKDGIKSITAQVNRHIGKASKAIEARDDFSWEFHLNEAERLLRHLLSRIKMNKNQKKS